MIQTGLLRQQDLVFSERLRICRCFADENSLCVRLFEGRDRAASLE
jgi:hypothetical protein